MTAQRLILYDGVCGFCDQSVQWVLEADREHKFKFAALQGSTADAIRARHPNMPKDIDTMVLMETDADGTERLSLRSAAAFRICAELGGGWRFFSWFGILPTAITDLGYRAFASIRYRIFGRIDSCRLPSPEERPLFLP